MRYFNKKWPGFLFLPLALLYGAIIFIRNIFYELSVFKTHQIDRPVISVGNVTVGGSGKTPAVQFLARYFIDKGKSVCILSRGYGRSSKGTVVVSDGRQITCSPDTAGDEPYLLARLCPSACVIVDENRIRAAQFARNRFNPDIFLLDDGFQHRKLGRDIDIVALRADQPYGNGFLLPAGPLREPKFSLRRADILWFNHTGHSPKVPLTNKPTVHVTYRVTNLIDKIGKTYPPNLTGKSVIGFCGLGTPESFRHTLDQLGATISDFVTFKDHHQYTNKDIEDLETLLRKSDAELILTTEKDWVKLPELKNLDHWCYLRITVEILDMDTIDLIEKNIKSVSK